MAMLKRQTVMFFTSTILLSCCVLDAGDSMPFNTVYVIPNDNLLTQCPAQNCYTFSELVDSNNTDAIFKSNTVILMLPGDHVVNTNMDLYIDREENLQFTGIKSQSSDQKLVRILCSETHGFRITFSRATNLIISYIEFVGCSVNGTYNMSREQFPPRYGKRNFNYMNCTLCIMNSDNITVHGVAIVNTRGVGLYMYNVNNNLTMSHCLFANNTMDCSIEFHYLLFSSHNNNNTVVKITESKFIHRNSSHNIGLVTLELLGKSFQHVQGRFCLISAFNHQPIINSYSLTISSNKYGFPQNGIMKIADSQFENSCLKFEIQNSNHEIVIERTSIDRCSYSSIKIQELIPIHRGVTLKDVSFTNADFIEMSSLVLTIRGKCTFSNNTGVVYAKNSHIVIDRNSTLEFTHNKAKCTIIREPLWFTNNYYEEEVCSTLHLTDSKIKVHGNSKISFRKNTAMGCGGMTLYKTNINFTGNSSLIFERNTGRNGGGMEMKSSSINVTGDLKPNIKFIGNHAQQSGGAIHVHRSYRNCSFGKQLTWDFLNNTAKVAGNTIYANIESWICEQNENRSVCQDFYSDTHFQDSEGDLSVIASDPTRVCVCVDSVPNCNITNYTAELFPGQMFEMQAVAVGLQYTPSPSFVFAEFNIPEPSWKKHKGSQYLQHVDHYCTTLRYNLSLFNSNIPIRTLKLSINTSNFNSKSQNWIKKHRDNVPLLHDLLITFEFKNCSPGFTLKYKLCTCQQILILHGIECDMKTLSCIIRPSPKWISATYVHTTIPTESVVIVHDHCPFDYCIPDSRLYVDLRYPDKQCALNRSGILCGECQTNFSQVFGSSRCKQCSSLWLLLLPLFAIAGVALVVFLMLLNFTVAVGTINGLIFYANIVRANHAIFFPPQTTNSFLSWFIAWLNLDLGIEICFYDGLDAYAKTWLQFAFPFYILFIVILTIVLCRYSNTLSRLCGSNAIQVLATLFLLSYTKLLRLIITILQPATLVYSDGLYKRVWLYDGNVDYLKGKHIPLFIAALLVLMLLSIPYTTTLLTIQWLQKFSHYRPLFWVLRLKPLFDAHTGPFKDNHRYWVGLLLLVRIGLFLVFSLNISNNPSINLLAISITVTALLAYLYLGGRVYKSRLVNAIEVSFFMNIGVLSAATLYQLNTSGDLASITHSLVGVAFITFIAITLYHIFQRIVSTKRGAEVKAKLEYKFKSQRPLEDTASQFELSYTSNELRESLLGSDFN